MTAEGVHVSARSIPPEFVLGAATAAFQIEGAAAEDGRTDSIWDAFCRTPGAVLNGDTGDVACDHYHRWRDDVALMRDLDLDAYRFSTSWSRVRPDGGDPNPAGVAFYDRLVDELLASGIDPWLTLYHWDMPQTLQEKGGWAVRETVDRFVEYALTLHDALGDRITRWTTFNEPWCSSFLSYTAGVHAPGRQSISEGLRASHHLLLAHGRTVPELRSRGATDIGITLNLTNADPVDATDEADERAARLIDGQFNRWFLDPLFRSAYPADIVEDIRQVDERAVAEFEVAIHTGDRAAISTPLDFLGVNYYHGEYVGGQKAAVPPPVTEAPTDRATSSPFPVNDGIYPHERGMARTNMGWEIDPDGLRRLLNRVWNDYAQGPSVPLYVTESGRASDTGVQDDDRVEYVRDHVRATLEAAEDGVDVRGFFYWSLLDNFEWAWGYGRRFGIVDVDYETQVRTVKASGREFSRLIRERSL
ncbi:MAG: GH1 family beta-glucosidase [Microbacterium sp.]